MKQPTQIKSNEGPMLLRILSLITFKSYRMKRNAIKRRRNYEEIKSLIVEHHLKGFVRLILKKKYDFEDLLAFRPPMYRLARTKDNKQVIYWRYDLMTEEIGPSNPSKDYLSIVSSDETRKD